MTGIRHAPSREICFDVLMPPTKSTTDNRVIESLLLSARSPAKSSFGNLQPACASLSVDNGTYQVACGCALLHVTLRTAG